jgi:glycosyltransferase involved in cell wall biosynthesis
VTWKNRLAVIGGFVRVPPSAPHGSLHAQFRLCNAIARVGRFQQIDVFHEEVHQLRARETVTLPEGVAAELVERHRLQGSPDQYWVIYVANGEQMQFAPHGLRPDDLAPMICEIGTAHHPAQWINFLLAAWNGQLRESDGFIFKTRTAETLFRQVWEEWRGRVPGLPFPTATVISNGVDLAANRRDDQLRAATRRQLGLRDDDVVFLTFSRLAAGTKGDYRALLGLWRQVVQRWPRAVLLLSGKLIHHGFVLHLQTTAREAGLGNNVIIAADPYEVWPDARERLMSAADAFVHLSTGVEETSPQSVHEAMAHGLPVIASHWAGLPEMIAQGKNGFLVSTHLSEPPPALQQMVLARNTTATNTELGRCVACDGTEFVRAAGVLLADPATRQAMGVESRRRAETLFDLQQVAARRVAFFDELGAAARHPARALRSPQPHPLVSFRSILGSLGQRALCADDVVSLSDDAEQGFRFLRGAPAVARDSSTMALVEFVLRDVRTISVGELVRRTADMVSPEGEDHDSAEIDRACKRALIRLLSYGLLAVAVPGETAAALPHIAAPHQRNACV